MASFEQGSVVLDSQGVATTKTGMAGDIYDAFIDNIAADAGIALPTGPDGLAMKQNLAMLANRIAGGAGKHIINYPPAAASILVKFGNTAQTGLDTNYQVVTNWTQNGPTVGDISPEYLNDQIVITEPGIYHISFSISFEGTNLTEFQFATYINGGIDGDLLCRRDTSAVSGQVANAGFSGFYQLNLNDVLEVWVQCNAASKSMTIRHACLSVNLIKRDAV